MIKEAREILGLAVSKYTLCDRGQSLEIVHFSDAMPSAGYNGPMVASLSSTGAPIQMPGTNRPSKYRLLKKAIDGPDGIVALDITPNGPNAFDIAYQEEGRHMIRGLGMIDPHDPESLLISWWAGDVKPYGIVKYTIEDASTISAIYISDMSPDEFGRGIAKGDTQNGFPGHYSLTYHETNGREWGPFDWRLTESGEVIDLEWRLEGKLICKGFGFIDPATPSLVVNYIAVG